MPKGDRYHPDYRRMYADVSISPEVLKALKQSDRKMEYMEVDLKRGRNRRDKGKNLKKTKRSKEISLDVFFDENVEFASQELSPEETIVYCDEIRRLRQALALLKPDEYSLIHAVYYKGISEEALGKEKGISQQGISKQLIGILKKLRILMEG